MAPERESSSDGTDPPTTRELTQWLAAITVVVGLTVVVAQSFGLAEIADSTLRIVLGAGIILAGGPKAIRALAEAFA